MSMIKKVFTSEIKSIDEDKMELTAYVSTGGRDRHNESVDPQGIDLSKFKKNPVVLWAHDYQQPPIAKAQWIKRDGEGIISRMKFANTPRGKEVFQLYKDGFMRAFSIGFMPDVKGMEEGDGEKKPRMTYRKSELLEYSAVPVPANPEALALAISKGVVSEPLKKEFAEYVNDEDKCFEAKNYTISGTFTEPDTSLLDELETIKDDNKEGSLSELTAENKQLNDKISLLEKDNGELRYKLYLSLKQNKPPEITVESLEAKTLEVLNGVIRKARGTVD